LIKGQAFGRLTARAIRYAIERKHAETALKAAEAGLQHERDQLEARVRERTAELSESNQALQAEIVQRQRAEEAHREVLRRLVAAEETERGHISRELHDRLGQDLTALKLGLQIVRKQATRLPKLRESVGKLESLADRLLQDIHRLAWELRPSALDDFGLEMALRRYADEWTALSGVAVDFVGEGVSERRLAREVETTLYRVAREALTNVFRHAAAKRVSVLLQRRADHVSLIVEDDGCGFDAAARLGAAASQDKLGLLGMQERATLAGGSVEIESSAGAGTTVFVRLPLAFEPNAI
jgi:signal transduction histidine kinase